MHHRQFHNFGNLILSTAALEMLRMPRQTNTLVATGALDIISGNDDLDELLFGADQMLFGADQMLFGADDEEMLFGADMADPDLAALSSVISGSNLVDPVDIAGTGLDIIGATSPTSKQQALARAIAKQKKAAFLKGLIAARKRQAGQQRLQQLSQAGIKPTLAVERGYTKARRFPFGLQADGPTAAGAPGSVTRRPQTPIKLARLVIPSTIAPAILITDIKIGKDSQLVGSDPIPGEVFAPNSVGVDLAGDTANVGNDVTVAFVNISGAPQQFRCALIGPAVE